MHSKNYFLLVSGFLLGIQLLAAAPIKLQINSDTENLPTVRSKENLLEIGSEPFITENPYILSSNGKYEIRMYDVYDNLKAFFLLSPLTDLQLSDNSSSSFVIASNFGRFRCVSGSNDSFIIHAKNGVTITIPPNSDVIYSCVSDLSRMYNTNIAVFSGEANVYKGKKTENFDTQDFILRILPMQIAEIENPLIINVDDITNESLAYFQRTNSRKAGTFRTESGIRPVLETLTPQDKPGNKTVSTTDDIIFYNDGNDDFGESIKMPEKKRVITDFARFRLSFIFQNNKIGGSIGWHPNIKTTDDLFDFSLRFDIPFLIEFSNDFSMTPIKPERIWDNFLKINDFRSEWFADSIIDSKKPEEAALGIIENLLVKIDKLRWGNENTPFLFMLGTKEAKTDKNALRYFFYSPSLFLPVYRATSIDFAYRNQYVTAEFFAENIPYGGLFDNSVQIFTPLKSMKSRIEIDFAIDTYRLRQDTIHTDSNAALPLYTDVSWSFTAFDLPYFGYEFYLNTGLVFPLVPYSENVFLMNPENIRNMIHFTFGQKFRGGKSPTFSIELFFKSTNMHYFTPLYFLFKEKYLTELARKSANSDYDIGAKLGISWQPLSWIQYYTFYRPAVSVTNLFAYEDSPVTASYSDNLLMGLTISPQVQNNTITGNLIFALEWDKPADGIINSIVKKNSSFLYENVGMHICTQVLFADVGTLGIDFSFIPSTESIKFNGEIYFTVSFKGVSEKAAHHSDISQKRMHELKKIISQQEQNSNINNTDGENNEN